MVSKKYNRLARRNGVHHIENIKCFEWVKRNVSIWGENYVIGEEGVSTIKKKIFHKLRKE